jgi:hypothetical protein
MRAGRLRRALTVQNVLATAAVFASLAGSGAAAYAAVKLTGSNVKNETITSVDIKNGSLAATNFSTTAKTAIKAMVGPKGATGLQGAQGNKGSVGSKGADGPDAGRAYSYITAEDTTNYVSDSSGLMVNPTSLHVCGEHTSSMQAALGIAANCTPYAPVFPHWAWDCEYSFPHYCALGDTWGAAGAGATVLHPQPDGVVGFTGDKNGSFVTLMNAGNIVVTGSLSFVRPFDNVHSRVACQPRVRRSNTADQYTYLGVPTFISGSERHEIAHMTVTGAGHFATAGDYDYEIECRLVDAYQDDATDDWVFVSGNATASTTEM